MIYINVNLLYLQYYSYVLNGILKGTGCNACYEEEIKNVELFDGDQSKQHVIINTEWGAFGDQGMLDDIFTVYDNVIDNSSLNVGRQRYVFSDTIIRNVYIFIVLGLDFHINMLLLLLK